MRPVTQASRLSYRPDIDGLRAVAVALVVAFHFGLPGIGGGYIGVDLFFVISGFLIAAMLERAPRITAAWLLQFYGRRVKRLLPAFLVVALASIAVATFLLLPEDYEALLKSIRESLAFRAQLYFERETTGYFAANAAELPWLHTWSLSIEWWFYFAFPFVMLALRRVRAGRPRRAVLFALVAVGLAASIAMVNADPSRAYFSAAARAFECLSGAFAATIVVDPRRLRWSRWAVAVALASLLAVACLFTAATPFPGAAALLVCGLGAVPLVLGAGSLLATRELVWLGRRSYSIYLWHWPVVALMAYVQWQPAWPVMIGWVLVVVVLADLTYRFVERPGIALSWRPATSIALLCVVPFVGVAGFYLFVRNHAGFPDRLGPEAAHASANLRRFDFKAAERCHDHRDADIEPCAFGDLHATKTALMIGDSHARQLRPFVDALADEVHVKVYGLTESQCLALEGTGGSANRMLDGPCRTAIARDFALIRDRRYDFVMIAERWIGYDRGALAGLDASIATIVASGAVPVLFGSTAEDGTETKACFYRHIKIRRPFAEDCDIHLDSAFAKQTRLDRTRMIDDLKGRYPTLIVVDLEAAQCRDGRCTTVIDGTPTYDDTHHLNAFGAAMLERRYRERFANPLSRAAGSR